MRLSTSITLLAVSTLALLASRTTTVSAALTVEEVTAIEDREGPSANLCPACLQKAMHNHFPHACDRDMDSTVANDRPSGTTAQEERCVCLAFQDLFWMKADCSAECPYVHRPATMKYFLPSAKIEGCDKWMNFETGQELEVEGFPKKNPEHKPEVFEIAPPPPGQEDDENDDGRAEVVASYTTSDDDKKKAEEVGDKKETKKDDKKADAVPEAKEDKKETVTEPEAAADVKKDEL
ncbi:hypothetical protein BGX33_008429 [Mortierella sp. NVP41]|nr:hypothetical protein BGX33_008429 [Mortierella sp. NVP41]